MKKFLKKTIYLTFSFFCVYIFITEIIVRKTPSFSAKFFIAHDWLNTNLRIHSSNSKILNDTIYVGCSVAGQLLPFEKNANNQLTFVGATLPVGNYFLIKNAIQKNKNISTVIYYTVPQVLGSSFAKLSTHQYFVKPFYTFKNRSEILNNEYMKNLLMKNKYLDFNLFNFYKLLPFNDFDYSLQNNNPEFSISNESIEWIEKIDSLCNVNNVKFYLASPPIAMNLKQSSKDWLLFRKKTSNSEIKHLFEKYFESIIYYDDINTKDNIHMNKEFAKRNRNKFLNFMKKEISKEGN